MTRKLLTLALISVICCGCNTTEKISPVPFNKVELTDGFWKAKVDTVISVTVPFSLQQSETAINRFRQCIDFIDGISDVPAAAHRFISSDMYKVLEGAAYSLMTRPDKEIEDKIDYIAELISKVQRPDGYLYISHICGNPIVSEMGPKPYSFVVHSHELYNMGHLYSSLAESRMFRCSLAPATIFTFAVVFARVGLIS
ncbi:MAG: glycoside hydrolase family 127 protein [Bacteroidales bacterium]|nr:glycoside hydrolase family 127 protein [Bacteroidales bacterium]